MCWSIHYKSFVKYVCILGGVETNFAHCPPCLEVQNVKCFDLLVAKIQPCYQRRDFDLVVYAHLIRTVSLNVFLMFHSTL